MTLEENLQQLAVGVGDEVKKVRVFINNNAANLNALTTTNKTSLVAAINELKTLLNSVGSGNASIDDSLTSTATTWSSAKVVQEIDEALTALVGGAPEGLDTIEGIAAALNDDPAFYTTMQTRIDQKVSWNTAAQGLTDSQKNNARINIGAASIEDVGDTLTNFVSTFNAGLL